MIALMLAFVLGCDDGDTTKTTTSTEGTTEIPDSEVVALQFAVDASPSGNCIQS